MPRDSGGWSSAGKRVECKKCGNTDATLITTVIYGKRTKTLYCEVCSASWEPEHGDSEK